MLGASIADVSLSRLVLPELLDDLVALGEATAAGDAEEVYRKLTRLDDMLSDMASRAARSEQGVLMGEEHRSLDAAGLGANGQGAKSTAARQSAPSAGRSPTTSRIASPPGH